jgi:hypothetical protein
LEQGVTGDADDADNEVRLILMQKPEKLLPDMT